MNISSPRNRIFQTEGTACAKAPSSDRSDMLRECQGICVAGDETGRGLG